MSISWQLLLLLLFLDLWRNPLWLWLEEGGRKPVFRFRVEPCVLLSNLLPFEHTRKECPLADSVFLFFLLCFVVVVVVVLGFSYGEISYGSSWKKDVVNQCLELTLNSLYRIQNLYSWLLTSESLLHLMEDSHPFPVVLLPSLARLQSPPTNPRPLPSLWRLTLIDSASRFDGSYFTVERSKTVANDLISLRGVNRLSATFHRDLCL